MPASAQKTVAPMQHVQTPALTPLGKSKALIQTELRYFDPAVDEQEIWFVENINPIDSGFVFGTNFYEDQAKAVAFQISDTLDSPRVKEVNVWFGYVRTGLDTLDLVTVELYNGTLQAGPTGAPLYSDTLRLADVAADDNLNTSESPTRVMINDTSGVAVTAGSVVFASIGFGSYTSAGWGNAALVSSGLVGARVSEVWEQWSNDSWHNVSDAWFSDDDSQPGNDGWYPWIELVVDEQMIVDAEEAPGVPGAFRLHPNYPNPFAGSTEIAFDLRAAGAVRLTVFNALGQQVGLLIDRTLPAGLHRARFDGVGLPSGVYLVRLETAGRVQHRTMTLLR